MAFRRLGCYSRVSSRYNMPSAPKVYARCLLLGCSIQVTATASFQSPAHG